MINMATLEERVKELEDRIKPPVLVVCMISIDGVIAVPGGDVLTKEEYERLKAKYANDNKAYFITITRKTL